MKPVAQPRQPNEAEPLTPEQEAAVKAAGVWVNHFARTLKTCRLYEPRNPTVVRFRQELAAALTQLLDEHGTLALAFTAEDVVCEGVSLYAAKSRDDNVAFPFYRDGVRSIALHPGFEAWELERLLDAVLVVTGQNVEHNDLVTLIWEAHLPHLDLDYVPGEPDMGGGGGVEGEGGVPWPTGAADVEEDAAPEVVPSAEIDVSPTSAKNPARSDDWSVGEFTVEIEAGYAELETLATAELERFRREYQDEREMSLVASAIALVRAYLAAPLDDDDRLEIARFLPRLLRQAFVQGSWQEANQVLALLDENHGAEWSRETFGQELLQPISVSSIRERLEAQDPATVDEFVRFTRGLGEPAVDLLNLVLAEMQDAELQKPLVEAIVDLSRDNPERLAPWLADPRWFVVRNIVQILGAIGGGSTVGMLRAVSEHPEPRVRHEVLAALRRADPARARPVLLEMLGAAADTRAFCAILHALSQERDPDTARLMLGHLLDPEFEKRSIEERRAIYSALSTTGGDEVLPELEAELNKGNWFSRAQEDHRKAVARCLARIGTEAARAALERGAASKRAPVRKACEDALVGLDRHE